MSFYDIYNRFKDLDFNSCLKGAADSHEREFFFSLMPIAEDRLEETARKARKITLNNFGRAIQLYTPLYLSNYCENSCIYCGFNKDNETERKKLSLAELEKEAAFIASSGLRHILILTGESRDVSGVSYIKECVRILKKYFSSIAIEIYPLTEDEYRELVKEGVDGLTLYQETYDEEMYKKVHPAGPKKDYRFRMDAPERALKAGMRTVNIGALLGLSDWRKDSFLTGFHAKYLQDKFTDAEISVSIPRVRPHTGNFKPVCKVSDRNIVQIILAMRVFLPRVGITLSTRESSALRENLVSLGVTKMSAGSTTAVGGHTITYNEKKGPVQFEISDERGVDEIKKMLLKRGYQPVLKDWMHV
ncbi:MAG: 2-iminoacetate synthase ThiH [Candidatus Omnitrophota bacterium]